jgi:drug/metabolite transporter (DMT)-like permease
MVFLLAVVADVLLGVGWVLQQRVAARTRCAGDTPWQTLRRLIGTGEWWAGIAAMAFGQTMAAWALQEGPVALVEPLLVGCLLFAFGFAAWRCGERIKMGEVLGSVIVIGGIALFISAAQPQADVRNEPALFATLVAVGAVAALATIIVIGGKVAATRHHIALESAAFAAAAGALYALQDVATRGAIDVVQRKDLVSILATSWPYVLLAGATAGVLVSQAAFRAARLDWSLPPTVTVQPLVGVGLAVGLLGDRLRLTPLTIPVEAISLPLTLIGVLIVGRSLAMRRAHGLRGAARAEVEAVRQRI